VSVVSETHLDQTAERYRSDVVEALGREVDVVASFVLGSGLLGAYRPGESDLDLVVVVDRPLEAEARRRAIERIAELELPGRRLELTVYVHGRQPPAFDLNLEVDAEGVREAPDEHEHWFVIDAAIAQERAELFRGRPWGELLAPVSADEVRQAAQESLDWSLRQPADDEFARGNAVRSRHYLEHGDWITKKEASE
jgi:predicted nucleotidyltransferase